MTPEYSPHFKQDIPYTRMQKLDMCSHQQVYLCDYLLCSKGDNSNKSYILISDMIIFQLMFMILFTSVIKFVIFFFVLDLIPCNCISYS